MISVERRLNTRDKPRMALMQSVGLSGGPFSGHVDVWRTRQCVGEAQFWRVLKQIDESYQSLCSRYALRVLHKMHILYGDGQSGLVGTNSK